MDLEIVKESILIVMAMLVIMCLILGITYVVLTFLCK